MDIVQVIFTCIFRNQHGDFLPQNLFGTVAPDYFAGRIEANDFLLIINSQDAVGCVFQDQVGLLDVFLTFFFRDCCIDPAPEEDHRDSG